MLRSKNLIKKVCITCKMNFVTDNKNARVCPSCKEKTKIKNKKRNNEQCKKPKKAATPKVEIPIHQLMHLLVKYNQTNNTNYTYGQFVEALHNGDIKLDDI